MLVDERYPFVFDGFVFSCLLCLLGVDHEKFSGLVQPDQNSILFVFHCHCLGYFFLKSRGLFTTTSTLA